MIPVHILADETSRLYEKQKHAAGRRPLLNGHGGCRKYHCSFGLDESPNCPTYEGAVEVAKYVFFACPRFESSKKKIETGLKTRGKTDVSATKRSINGT